jgi:hypothetical protein
MAGRQPDVTDALAEQLLEALTILLAGFEAAGERAEALDGEDDHLYGGLLTLLLRLVFLLYAEDRDLLHGEHLSVHALHDALQADHVQFPDTRHQRFGAYLRLLASVRASFDPERDPFLAIPSISDEAVYLVLDKLMLIDGQRLSYRALEVEQIGSVYEALMGYHMQKLPASGGRLVIQPCAERRRTSSHYTPRSLSEPIVQRTLEPLIAAMDERGEPSSEQLLRLKVCDPAMGSGAFLLAAVRYLADQVVAAWTREGVLDIHEDPVMHARRLVAQKCIYGVDKNPLAVHLAKLSLWLETHARAEPFTFVDHALKCGDSLVGLDLEQIKRFDWMRGGGQPLDLFEGVHERARMIGDCVVGAFFAEQKDKARRAELGKRRRVVEAWLLGGVDAVAPVEVRQWVQHIREQVRPFHWCLEFPELFCAERSDSLHAIVGNPPYLGISSIRETLGPHYFDWLVSAYPGSGGKADLCAFFVRLIHVLSSEHGTVGIVATNSIAQGDSRRSGLARIVECGAQIVHADTSIAWARSAGVTVSTINWVNGLQASPKPARARLDGRLVTSINSRLRAGRERDEPAPSSAARGYGHIGVKLYGDGFILTPEEARRLTSKSSHNSRVIAPYIGGEEINRSPRQSFHRHVIDFGDRSLEAAVAEWPELLDIVRDRVKPQRDKLNRKQYRDRWWQHGEKQLSMRQAVAALERCLVSARITKHLCISFQPTDRVMNEKICVFAYETHAVFAVLQARTHDLWAWTLGSTMREDLNYSIRDCFETFPFPSEDHLGPESPLEQIGERLYAARAQYMLDTDQGLTKTYNALKDPEVTDPRIRELRELHLELDRIVLAAYGWSDIEIPPYTDPGTLAEQAAKRAFEDEIIDRLFVLNAERAAEERKRGSRQAKKGVGTSLP